MSVFLFAVVDPDLNLPPTSITYYREKISLPPESDLTQVFIILSSTTFSHIPQMLPRGLELVVFNGKLRDSEQMISISISELTELWTSVLEDFSKIFHITFRLYPSQKSISEVHDTGSVALYNMFLSPPDRAAIRLAKEGKERGDFLPLLRSEWCALGTPHVLCHQPYLEKQWNGTVDLLFRANEIRFAKEVVHDRHHALYIFIDRFCLLLSRLNFRWSKIVAADSSFAACSVLGLFFNKTSLRGFSNNDGENQIDNHGEVESDFPIKNKKQSSISIFNSLDVHSFSIRL